MFSIFQKLKKKKKDSLFCTEITYSEETKEVVSLGMDVRDRKSFSEGPG